MSTKTLSFTLSPALFGVMLTTVSTIVCGVWYLAHVISGIEITQATIQVTQASFQATQELTNKRLDRIENKVDMIFASKQALKKVVINGN